MKNKIKPVKAWAIDNWKTIVVVYLTQKECNLWVINNPSISCKIYPVLITLLKN